MSDNVMKLSRLRDRCQHNKYIVDPSLNTVECGLCGKALNPMWVLEELATKESRLHGMLDDLKMKINKASSKLRCKCEHCKKMTRIER